MSKRTRIFINILYYVLTFGIGILIAIVLPTSLAYTVSMRKISSNLEEGKYARAIELIGGYADAEYKYLSKDDKGNIVIFNTVTLVYGKDGDKAVDGTKIHKSYSGFFYQVADSYKTVLNSDSNKTKLVITDKDGVEHKHNLVDYDQDNDGVMDSISTLVSYKFIYFEIPIEESSSVKQLDFYDSEGNIFKTISLPDDQVWSFNEDFFHDVDAFVTEYNNNYQSAKLIELDEEFRKNPNYLKSTNQDIIKTINRKTTIYIILYFALIYLIGDSLIGARYVIKGIMWLVRKITKKQPKQKVDEPQEIIGENVFCQLSISLDVEEDFEYPVTVFYSNSVEKLEFNLLKQDGYRQSKRVKAGTYMNLRIELNSAYEAIGAPEKLTVTGFKRVVFIKIRKKIEEIKNEN